MIQCGSLHMFKDTEQCILIVISSTNSMKKMRKLFDLIFRSRVHHDRAGYENSPCNLLIYSDSVAEQQLMFLLQWLLRALRRVFFGHAGGRSPLKAILSLWHFFERLFQHFLRTRNDGGPDKPPQRMAVQDLPRDGEPAKYAVTPAVDGETDELVPSIVCRSAALPNDLRSSNGMALVSVASRSQTGLALETDLNPSNGYPPPHSSPSIEGSVDSSACPNCSQLSHDISSTAYNSAAGAHLNLSHVHLPHVRPTSGQGRLSSDSEAVVVPLPSTPASAQHDGQSQDDVPNSTLHNEYPYIRAAAPEVLGIFSRNRSVHIF